MLAHLWYGRTGDIDDAIEVGVNYCLEPLRTQLLERRNIAEPGVVNDDVETPKSIKRYLHGGLSRAFIRDVKRNRADVLAEFLYQVSVRSSSSLPLVAATASMLLKVMLDPATPAATKVRAANDVLDHAERVVGLQDIEARLAELERSADQSKPGWRNG